MKEMSRRRFLGKSFAAGAVLSGLTLGKTEPSFAKLQTTKSDISLAQWALNREIRKGMWNNLDFPRIAREVFDINGIEFVSQFFEAPTYQYLKRLKKNAEDYNVTMVLIMVNREGEPGHPDNKERRQFVINHKKWIDIANFLGCHAIRTNCKAPNVTFDDGIKYATDSYNELLEYAVPAKVSVLIENHGGLSDDPDFLVALAKKINNLYFGMLPDWRRPGRKFDNVERVKKLLSYAHGMSYRNQPTDELTEKMIRMCMDAGFRGYYGIESNGREEIKKGKKILERVLFGKE